ncbi:hypothetical protein KGP65_05100 [Burkholderia multivorans]|nr:hypothetical protein [Burkholderia multivorans]MBU9202429.1 hypothetical protein [Burkholderia multivorans]MCA8385910.1 hypothetical protein [Burkholderia multivorans]MCO8315097.1 hypothetical protein [Burkholderia multivorans]MCO8350261.1 hypothetical protein [Burkholderia multivorans]MCO8385143.1 hypothetical protein [Burkholderia multivorans]
MAVNTDAGSVPFASMDELRVALMAAPIAPAGFQATQQIHNTTTQKQTTFEQLMAQTQHSHNKIRQVQAQ